MKLGYLQKQIIDLGKKKGFVTNQDVEMFYQVKDIKREMNKLVILGYFDHPEDCVTYVKWKFKQNDSGDNQIKI